MSRIAIWYIWIGENRRGRGDEYLYHTTWPHYPRHRMVYLCITVNNQSMRPLAGIVGFRGYSGAELARMLERHPRVTAVLLEHREGAPGHPRSQCSAGP